MKGYLVAMAVALAAVMSLAALSVQTDAEEGDGMLIDMGNGVTYWTAASGSDAVAMAEDFAKSKSLDFEKDGSRIVRIGEMEEHSVGTQVCGWHLYKWSGTAWTAASDTSRGSGSIAWGFYPEGTIPVETPEYRTAWTQFRGDSANSGASDSYGTEKAVTPVEWYKTYRTGYVDSSIIVAGDLMYHTTYGETTASGSRSHAQLYCLNRLTADMVWIFDLTTGGGKYPEVKDNGYNITSPVVIGDMIAINSATSHSLDGKTVMDLYLLDRFTGKLIDTEEVLHAPPLNERGMPVWTGRTFINGGTSPVYDSGALYFATSDGRVLAYSVSHDGLERLWEYVPPSDVVDGKYTGTRGSFYYYSPTIVDVDGVRMLYVGNYEGYVIALDASTGKSIWEKRLIALYEKNTGVPNTPGAVDLITYIGDNRLVVTCTDGAMSPGIGHIVCVDAKTGEGPGGKDCYWRTGGVTQGTVPVGNGEMIVYAMKSTRPTVDTDPQFTEDGVYRLDKDGNTVWKVKSNYIWSRMTVADGLLYYSEYSAGFYDDGGHIVALKVSDGSTVWSIKLEPYSKVSYSMAAPTVIDGKIYAANDYGAVYCISETEGKKWDGDGEIILPGGFWHWSWALLITLVIAAIVALVRYY